MTEKRISQQGFFGAYWSLYYVPSALWKHEIWWICAASLFTSVCCPIWNVVGGASPDWLNDATQVIPSLLSFSLGGMAILLAFSSDRLLNAIQQRGKADSLYMKTVASFFHFILWELIALLAVFLVKSYPYDWTSNIAFFLFSYGSMSVVVAAGNLFKLAQIFNLLNSKTDDQAKQLVQPEQSGQGVG